MLTELRISNFALIEEQRISFGAGLNVICGETGAGKSLVLQALELILGGRSKPQYFRSGVDTWEIEALFDLSALDPSARDNFPEGFDADELLLSRSQSASGKGRVSINGKLGSVSLLQQISSSLINICRQGQAAQLLEPAYHLALLDQYNPHSAELRSYQGCFAAWRALKSEFDSLQAQLKQGAIRRAELEFVVSELGNLNLEPGLREQIQSQVSRASVAESLLEKGAELDGIINSAGGVSSMLGRGSAVLKEISRLDPELTQFTHRLDELESSLGDLWVDFSRTLKDLSVDQGELEQLRERLAEIARIERKYHMDCAGLLSYLERSRKELSLFEDRDSASKLEAQLNLKRKELDRLGVELTASRKSVAKKLISLIERELLELGMPHAKLAVEVEASEPGPSGCDRVRFLFSSNKGEAPQPLNQVASGGELSRLMLVLKKTLRDRSGVNVLVFDEVDSGISGAVARSVGEKLKELATQSQVICITHLAQVASLADSFFRVTKNSGKRTYSEIELISGEEKVEEIAKMLAGYTVTAASRESARELLSSKT